MTDEPKGKFIGKTWYIPEDAQKPERANKKNDTPNKILEGILHIHGKGTFRKVKCAFD